MGLLDDINQQLKEAMKSKDENALNTLRSIKSALNYRKTETGGDLEEADVVEVLRKEAKKRKDSIEQFRQGGRDDLVEREQAQLEVLDRFLPEEMGDEQIEARAKEVIEEMGASSKKEMGKVMGRLMPEMKGKADGNRVKNIVSGLLE